MPTRAELFAQGKKLSDKGTPPTQAELLQFQKDQKNNPNATLNVQPNAGQQLYNNMANQLPTYTYKPGLSNPTPPAETPAPATATTHIPYVSYKTSHPSGPPPVVQQPVPVAPPVQPEVAPTVVPEATAPGMATAPTAPAAPVPMPTQPVPVAAPIYDTGVSAVGQGSTVGNTGYYPYRPINMYNSPVGGGGSVPASGDGRDFDGTIASQQNSIQAPQPPVGLTSYEDYMRKKQQTM